MCVREMQSNLFCKPSAVASAEFMLDVGKQILAEFLDLKVSGESWYQA